jgi:DNA-binding beta-propeller fold protein YncE
MTIPPEPSPELQSDSRPEPAPDPSVRRALPLIAVLAVITIGLIAYTIGALSADEVSVGDATAGAAGPSSTVVNTASTSPTTTATTTTTPTTTLATTTTTTVPAFPTDQRVMELAFRISRDNLQPKSIVASPDGRFVAQNMMYRHNVSVFDGDGALLAEIDDTVDLAAFGVADGPVAKGSPVEAAFSPDGRHLYVSNYKMYGPGFNPIADDECNRGNWDDSYVYRIDMESYTIDGVVAVGAVPKFLAVSPDGEWLVVSNWCGFDASVIRTSDLTEVARVNLGRHPRGIAIDADSRLAYVSVMGAGRIAVIDLNTATEIESIEAGISPRHLLLSPDGRYMYVSNNLQGGVRKIDLTGASPQVFIRTGERPRSMALSEDGLSLYVVHYESGGMIKISTADMRIVQRIDAGSGPVGVTYEPTTARIWVADYRGVLWVFDDRLPD